MTGPLFQATYGTLEATHLASGATVDVCTSAGGGALCPVLALAYASYLLSYLPETYFVGCNLIGTMQLDGTGSRNSGLFIRRTLREMLFGCAGTLDPGPWTLDPSSGASCSLGAPGSSRGRP